jgi:hypothetical protein
MKSSVTREDAYQIYSTLRNQGMGVLDMCFLPNYFSARTLPIFHPEFGRFMLEATPGKPWGIGFKDLLDVEPNMKLR